LWYTRKWTFDDPHGIELSSFELTPETRYLTDKGKKTDRLYLEANIGQSFVVIYCGRCKAALQIGR
jgi:hypothetical protein